jgi:capsular polysaccharide biosynthesis protein
MKILTFMKNIIKSFNFWLFSGLLASVIFVYLVNINRTYQSETEILILPKSQMASENFDQIIDNSKVIIESLSFYDAMILSNHNIEDRSQAFSLGKRKNYWENMVRVERIENSGAISVLIYEDYINQAEVLGRQSAETLKNELGKMYNIDEDISIVLLEGPIITESPKANVLMLIAESLIAGILVGLILNCLYIWIREIKFSLKIDFKIPRKPFRGEIFPWRKLEEMKEEAKEKVKKSFSKEPAEQPDLEKQRQFIENIIKQKMEEEQDRKQISLSQDSLVSQNIAPGNKAGAPSNLPVFEEQIVAEILSEKLPEKEAEEIFDEQPVEREATTEEIKERLNKLLSGKI